MHRDGCTPLPTQPIPCVKRMHGPDRESKAVANCRALPDKSRNFGSSPSTANVFIKVSSGSVESSKTNLARDFGSSDRAIRGRGRQRYTIYQILLLHPVASDSCTRSRSQSDEKCKPAYPSADLTSAAVSAGSLRSTVSRFRRVSAARSRPRSRSFPATESSPIVSRR